MCNHEKRCRSITNHPCNMLHIHRNNLQAAQSAFMADLWRDSVGFMGAVMIRRMVGIAHVAEMKSIQDPDVRWVIF